jgi:phenylacetic acid degradation operon negative regulatory protein
VTKDSLAVFRTFILSSGALQPKTEEFLYFLLWSADQLLRPTFRNLNDSYENWAYHNGLFRQIALLEKQRFIERKSGTLDARVYRLTAQGRLHALGGRDPTVQWSRTWDGRWRLVLFDLPATQNSQRVRLRRYLRDRGFGYLQNSVWITPDPFDVEAQVFRGARIDVESLIVMEARPCAGESDAEIVAGAWDFDRINRLYEQHLKILMTKPTDKLQDKLHARTFRQWAKAERAAWREAINSDPLLPERLLPRGYLGRRAWERRIKVLGKAKRDLETYKP